MQIITKKQYALNAVVLSLVGIASFALGLNMYLSPKQVINVNAIKGEKFIQCQSAAALANMGASVEILKNKVTIISPDLSNYHATLASASFIISECEGFVMKEMCFGSSCSTSGLVMELEYSPKARAQKSEVHTAIQKALTK